MERTLIICRCIAFLGFYGNQNSSHISIADRFYLGHSVIASLDGCWIRSIQPNTSDKVLAESMDGDGSEGRDEPHVTCRRAYERRMSCRAKVTTSINCARKTWTRSKQQYGTDTEAVPPRIVFVYLPAPLTRPYWDRQSPVTWMSRGTATGRDSNYSGYVYTMMGEETVHCETRTG